MNTEPQPQRSEQQEWTPDLFMGEKLIPYEQRPFHVEQIATDLGYKIIGRYVKVETANAALAAEREDVRKAREGWEREVRRADDAEAAVGENCRTIARLEKELTAERQRREKAEIFNQDFAISNDLLRQQLLSALAAIAKHNKQVEADDDKGNFRYATKITVDLSLLHEHDRDIETRAYAKGAQDQHGEDELVRKPLVDLLNYIRNVISHEDYRDIIDRIDALAKVKQ